MTYRIGELAKLTDLSEHTLRFYEKEGLLVPKRNVSNVRVYSEDDRLWAEFIVHMKGTGMSLEDLKKYKDLRESDSDNYEELVAILIRHKENVEAKMAEYQHNLDLMNKKIAMYEQYMDGQGEKDLYDRFVKEKRTQN
ncbi:DNA-binding transcriptional regulator, MerR family [Terribacillus halophilus]|uniref:DNA-binding transcriptional regulator, MerR family n=1 Tax=Terribacillus halophilus TaxID=361279 RepID=A0A1G6QFD6_9BACI|nr:MerR family transcriptional regulator [Terribacillus halophilus]SDC91028.1 DNA-binding transcriptional regulator, MerR family [Terribacillus halophilus]